MYWIGSHSRSGKGRLREQRWQFFATRLSKLVDHLKITPTSAKAPDGLLAPINALDARLSKKIKLDAKRDESLAPDNGGFNIEGLTARADGRSVLIGLRSPLFDSQAVLLPLENPEAVADTGAKPVLGKPIPLDLGGRGIRSIEYSAATGMYFVLAGPTAGESGTFELFRCPASETDPPQPIKGFAAGLMKLDATRPLRPEALVADAAGRTLHLFSDDGDSCNPSNPTFRSVAIMLE